MTILHDAQAVLPDVDLPQHRTSRGLTARAAHVALRIADLVEATCATGPAAPTVTFLRSWAEHTGRTGPGPADPSPPLERLRTRYGLGTVARDLLLLAGLPEEHEGLAGTFRALHPQGEPRPTLGLAALLADPDGDGRPLIRRLCAPGGVIDEGLVRTVGDGPLFERSVEPAPALWEALHGWDAWPAALARVPAGAPPPGLDGWLRLPAVRRAVAALPSPVARTVVLTGEDEAVVMSRCAAMAAAAGMRLLAARVAADDTAGARLLAAHAAVRDAVPVFCVTAPRQEGTAAPLDLSWLRGPALVCGRPGSFRPTDPRPVLTVPLGPLAPDDHRRAWSQGVPQLRSLAAVLAMRHPLDPALTAVVAADLRGRHHLGAQPQLEDVSAAIRGRAAIILPPGVSLSSPDVPWDRLVLPPEPARQLRDAVSRLDHRQLVLQDWGFAERVRAGRGVRLLFTGPPGTGKSLAAAAVASAARTDLLLVDVARLVSKWIGETEKNLAAAFDVAERTQAVLLLDEADALFGTRTQIKDANDRYANLETAYLLQRMDGFDGLVVLTSNLRRNIDAAFLRRMDFVVEFGLPDTALRARLWRLHLPGPARLAADVDPDVLARMYQMSGAWIRNAALGAAFLAAPDGGPITRAHLLHAIRREYAKAAQPYPGEPPRCHSEEPEHGEGRS
ncbi:ATP-dependent zinc metalloprotease FtsH [Streptomyces sp. RB5]|uniref:ATP-dependent zinc metalloprotease FtsH n=1 Tax=Streptomyces smaragdinus TaxID=2585196 RepID=A0A7K0CMA8_9ACTN|nr:ATP-binding protein [Streptomyces smaragdinus]MQY14610.1 ATP-dependent zinc metalloprotease FtsH [Streptomyces smaragdinus]